MGQTCDMCEGTNPDIKPNSRKETEINIQDNTPLLNPSSQSDVLSPSPPPLDNEAKTSNKTAVYEGWKNAIENNNDSLAMYLFEDNGHEYDLLEHVFDNGDRAIHTTVNKNNHKMLIFLLSSGAMVNSQNQNNGNTPLHYSVMNNQINLVTILLKYNADVSIANFENKLPIDLCNNNDIKELLSPQASYLLQKGLDDNAIHFTEDESNSPIRSTEKIESNDELRKNGSSISNQPSTSLSLTNTIDTTNIINTNTTTSIGTATAPATITTTTEQQTQSVSPQQQNQSNSEPMGGITTLSNDDLDDILGIDPTQDYDNQPKTNKNGGIKTDENFNANESLGITNKKDEIRALIDEQHQTTVIPIKSNEDNNNIRAREASKSITRVASKKLLETMQTIHQEQKKLPTLASWLEKRKPTPPHQWQRRWVVVKDSHMLWSEKQRDINDTSNPQERKKFNHSISLMVIEDVKPYDSKSGNKFIVVARDAKKKGNRDFIWKAISQEDRDYWIKGLNEHRKHIQSMLDYLGNKE